jgi:formyl-CoA transferase
MGDHMSACSLYGAIVTALYRRQRTGEGAMVGTSLLANGLWSNGFNVQAALDGARMTSRMDSTKLSPFTQVYACSDDRWFILTLLPQVQEQMWPVLARCVGHEEWLEDERFRDPATLRDNHVALTELLRDVFIEKDWDHWRAAFAVCGITCGAIAKSTDHVDCVQVDAAGMLAAFADGSSQRTVNSPLYVHGEEKRSPRPAPEVGEHSLAILGELGVDADTADRLRAAGVISQWEDQGAG